MGETVQLNIIARDEDFVGYFNVIEVHRATLTEKGPYTEVTGSKWTAARVPSGSGDPSALVGPSRNISGLDLELLVGNQELIITFTSPDPITYAVAASEIITQGQGLISAHVDSDSNLVIETLLAGTGAFLSVTGGEAAPELGFNVTDSRSSDYGEDPRLALVAGINKYVFLDRNGSTAYWYKTRFRNTAANSTSEFSDPFQPALPAALDSDYLILGVLDLIDIQGRPLVGQEVILHVEYNGILVDDKIVAGGSFIKATDENGHVEFTLARGQKVNVSIPGTDLRRTITVPTDATKFEFNLLDPSISGEDIFKVQVPNVVYAERRSL